MQLADLNKLLNSELTTKINNSLIENNELLVNTEPNNLHSVLLFLKSNTQCKFKQLIDIVPADYPNEEKRFKIYYLLLSHENNSRIKISINFNIEEKIPSKRSLKESTALRSSAVLEIALLVMLSKPFPRSSISSFENPPLERIYLQFSK